MTLAAWITVAGLVLVGSTGSGGVVYWLLNRKSQRIIDQKTAADREKIEADRADAIAAAAQKWQEIADESSTKAFEILKKDNLDVRKQCNECLDRLTGMNDVAGALIDAMEALLAEDTPQNRADARASVRLARRAMSH